MDRYINRYAAINVLCTFSNTDYTDYKSVENEKISYLLNKINRPSYNLEAVFPWYTMIKIAPYFSIKYFLSGENDRDRMLKSLSLNNNKELINALEHEKLADKFKKTISSIPERLNTIFAILCILYMPTDRAAASGMDITKITNIRKTNDIFRNDVEINELEIILKKIIKIIKKTDGDLGEIIKMSEKYLVDETENTDDEYLDDMLSTNKMINEFVDMLLSIIDTKYVELFKPDKILDFELDNLLIKTGKTIDDIDDDFAIGSATIIVLFMIEVRLISDYITNNVCVNYSLSNISSLEKCIFKTELLYDCANANYSLIKNTFSSNEQISDSNREDKIQKINNFIKHIEDLKKVIIISERVLCADYYLNKLEFIIGAGWSTHDNMYDDMFEEVNEKIKHLKLLKLLILEENNIKLNIESTIAVKDIKLNIESTIAVEVPENYDNICFKAAVEMILYTKKKEDVVAMLPNYNFLIDDESKKVLRSFNKKLLEKDLIKIKPPTEVYIKPNLTDNMIFVSNFKKLCVQTLHCGDNPIYYLYAMSDYQGVNGDDKNVKKTIADYWEDSIISIDKSNSRPTADFIAHLNEYSKHIHFTVDNILSTFDMAAKIIKSAGTVEDITMTSFIYVLLYCLKNDDYMNRVYNAMYHKCYFYLI